MGDDVAQNDDFQSKKRLWRGTHFFMVDGVTQNDDFSKQENGFGGVHFFT